ncbi:MAG: YceI family protein [Bacteroidota bacterium]
MKKLIQFTIALLLLAVMAPSLQAQGWTSDPVHSTVAFKVRHIVTPMIGKFDKFDVAIKWTPDNLGQSSINATVDATSVNTGNKGRDGHLQGPDFFDAKTHPEWSFTSKSIEKKGENEFVATGDMTMRGKTMSMEVPFTFLGAMEMDKGNKAGFETEFVIKRSEFGLGGDMGGGIGDDVTIMVLLEMNGK